MKHFSISKCAARLALLVFVSGCGASSADTLFQGTEPDATSTENDSEASEPMPPASQATEATETTPESDPDAPTPADSAPEDSSDTPTKTPKPGPLPTVDEECPSYEGAFLQRVHQPVCSNCHGSLPDLPDWGDFDRARASCNELGAAVGRGSMPPGDGLNFRLSEIVLKWVALGCPESQIEADVQCALPAAIEVERARLRDGELELRGTVSRPDVDISVEIGARVEPVINENGEFRQEFFGVPDTVTSITVRTSDGGELVAQVELD